MKKTFLYILPLVLLSGTVLAQTQIDSSPFYYNSAGETSIGIAPAGATLMIKQLTDTQSGGLRIRNANNQSTFFWMDAANVMHMENGVNGSRDFVFNEGGTGRVGIGMQPVAALHVLQATGSGPFAIIEGGGAVAENTGLRLYDRGTASGNINHLEFAFNGGAGGAAVTTRLRARNNGNNAANGGSFYLETAYNNTGGFNDNQLVLISNGNVGIGTASPDAKLAVKGDIHAQEVKVDLNGAVAPDYVFEDTYPLMSLSETEKYIQANKHLPEVPSAKEMEQNGVKLLEMNMLLLKKVEELTLHVISLEKEVQTLKSKEK